MPNINLSILNQKATPAFFADTLANRPAPSFVGRIFISTDTLDLYRDTGSAWLLLSPSSTGTITGSGASGQVTYFSGTSSITGNNNLFYDTALSHLGINTNTPGSALDVHDDQSTLVQLNQTNATNDTRIGFQNNGTALWRIGNFYNAGANDWGIFDVVGAAQPFTIKKTTGQTFIGAETTSSGRLVVNNTTGDNHIVVIGATAPSIRINNSGTGATRQIGIGLATTTNNFIQGAAGGEMAIFNSSTTASPILFGIYDAGLGNTQEAARISASRNFLVGQTADTGQTLQVTGSAAITGITQFSNTGAFVGFPGVTINQGSGTGIALSITKAGNNEGLYLNKISGTGNAATILGNVGIGASSFTSPSGADTILGVYGGQDCSLILQDAVQLWEVYVNDDFYINRNATNVLQLSRTTGAATFSNSVTASTTINIDTSANPTLNFITNSGATTTMFNIVGAAYVGSAPFNSNILRANNSSNISFETGGSEAARFVGTTRNLLIGTTTDAGYKLNVNGNVLTQGKIVTSYTTNEVQNVVIGNGNLQGAAQKYTLVRQYSAVASGNKLIIPFVSQNNLNSTTICKVYGHSARYNSRNALGFEINFSVGSLSVLDSLTSWGGGGNFLAISIAGMTIEIDFTTAYTSGTSDGIYVTIEYMTNEVNYSIDVPNITMN